MLVDRSRSYEIADWRFPNDTRVREQLAQLASAIDPAFATSATWPGETIEAKPVGPPDDRSYITTRRFTHGAFAVEVDEQEWQGPSWVCTATVAGLAPGWQLSLRADAKDTGCAITVNARLPSHVADAVLALVPR